MDAGVGTEVGRSVDSSHRTSIGMALKRGTAHIMQIPV